MGELADMTEKVLAGKLPEVSDNIKQALEGERLQTLKPEERVSLLESLCASLGLNPLTSPFRILTMKEKIKRGGKDEWREKTTVYATKDAAEQLRKTYAISAKCAKREAVGDVYIVEVEVADYRGRVDFATGAVSLLNWKGEKLTGEARANAMMKAETKGKRRATLSICGLGMLDETEIETIEDAAISPLPNDAPATQVPAPADPDPVPGGVAQESIDKAEEQRQAGKEKTAEQAPQGGSTDSPPKAQQQPAPEQNGNARHITFKEMKAMFELVGDNRKAFMAFVGEISTTVFGAKEPYTNSGEIWAGKEYDYLMDALKKQDSGICAFEEWLAARGS